MKTAFRYGIALASVGVVATTGTILWKRLGESSHKPGIALGQPVDQKSLNEVKSSPKDFIAKNEKSSDVKVQTLVTRARMTQAFELAKKKDYAQAREGFINASYQHKGTDAMNPEFGTLPDQAAYQAIVCLDAEGKDGEARKEYRKFMEERPLSPLVHACFRRLEKMNGGTARDEDQALLEKATAKQEANVRFELSVCGPKCLEKLLPLFGKEQKGYKELAKLCKTDDDGTTMANLKKGCDSLGLKPIGLELNASDFAKMTKPFMWLQVDHYVDVLEIKGGKALTYDPRYKLDQWVNLPKSDDSGFRAIVLAFEVPTVDLVADQTKYADGKPSNKS